ncbi:MAG TPA: PLP-dependent aminotransferase family protein [Pyrodictium sp.]|nr:PLP-dependent aminotransferase family protein [Pyrodictium sp.]
MVDIASKLSDIVGRIGVSEIRELLKLAEKPGVISLAGGLPDPRLFPREEIAAMAKRVVEELGEKSLQYAPTRGVGVLLEELKAFMDRMGILVRGDDGVIVTSGSQQALYLLSAVLLNPGDYVVVEKPTYLAAVGVFKLLGARFIPVDMDKDGMVVEELEEKLKRAKAEGLPVKMIYTIPTAHNPAGTTMPDDRRKYLLELAEQHDLIVVEDDPYGLIVFENVSFTKLKSLDRSGRVVYLGSFSKILAPGFRLGWAVGLEELVSAMEKLKQYVDLHSSTLTQYIATECLKQRIIERSIEVMRMVYREKRDAMLEALEEHMPEGVDWTRPIGGFFVFAWLPEKIDTRKMLRKAVEKGVAYVPGYAFYVDGSGHNTMRLNYSFPQVEEIREGVKRLAGVVREELL